MDIRGLLWEKEEHYPWLRSRKRRVVKKWGTIYDKFLDRQESGRSLRISHASMRAAHSFTRDVTPECPACEGTGTMYWNDGDYGWCTFCHD